MIKTRLFWSGDMQVGGVELIAVWRDQPESVIWVDLVENEKAAEAELLKRDFWHTPSRHTGRSARSSPAED